MPYKRTGRPGRRPRKAPSVSGKRPRLTTEQRLAIKFECENPTASGAAIARAAGVSRQAYHQWKENPDYRREVERRQGVRLLARGKRVPRGGKAAPFNGGLARALP